MSTHRTPGQRAGLDADKVLSAARVVLREDGMAGLSMRAVARRLGVAPNALYSYVQGKDELVDAVLDDVLAEVQLPSDSAVASDPLSAVRSIMLASYDVLLAHPGLMPAYLERQGARGVQAQRLGVVTLAALERAGLDERSAREAMRVLIVNTVGFAAFAAPLHGADRGPIPATELRHNFAQGLDWLLIGIAP